MSREAGILMPVSSLPGPYGIGDLGETAYAFVDFLAQAGQTYWQILPLNPPNHNKSKDSPYQSFSAFAGNPYYIDLNRLMEEGVLLWEEIEAVDFGHDPEHVDYDKMYANRCARPMSAAGSPRIPAIRASSARMAGGWMTMRFSCL